MKVKIATIGTGNMARTLGALWAEAGHEVFFGSRREERGRETAALIGRDTRGGTVDEAAAFGEVILHTARHNIPSDLLSSTEILTGKVLIDCNNALPGEGPEDGLSIAERIAADAPGARVVKAFNTMAQEIFEYSPEPLRDDGVSGFVCADDEGARRTVMTLAEEIGLVPVDCGPLRNAKRLEGLFHFLFFAMVELGLSPLTTVSLRTLPLPETARFGGRRDSDLSP